jgi:pimeloyl-ACP methyl ester carboxylesterase
MSRIVYLHGFASSPRSKKAQFFARQLEQHGVSLVIPALDGGDFEGLTISGQLALVDQAVGGDDAILIGSSLGGYLAALYASFHANIAAVVMMAPAFDFASLWEQRLGPAGLAGWEASGRLEVPHWGTGAPANIGWGFLADARRHPAWPDVTQPSLIFHGLQDDVVPPGHSIRYAATHPSTRLQLFADGHELTAVMDQMWSLTHKFLLPD